MSLHWLVFVGNLFYNLQKYSPKNKDETLGLCAVESEIWLANYTASRDFSA